MGWNPGYLLKSFLLYFTSGATTLDMQMALQLQEDTEKKDKMTMMTMVHHHRFVKHKFQVNNGQRDKQTNNEQTLQLITYYLKFQMHVLDGGVTWKLITIMMGEPFRGELLKKGFRE